MAFEGCELTSVKTPRRTFGMTFVDHRFSPIKPSSLVYPSRKNPEFSSFLFRVIFSCFSTSILVALDIFI